MAEINRAVRGTCDVLPNDSFKWQYVEEKMLEVSALYGYKEVRVPVFENTNVFVKGVGDTTDVVQKEMYTFEDKGGRSITLRPELTAGVIRSMIEHGETNGALPLKVCYIGGCYRYEKPQAGRLREFHQFGVECLGAKSPAADAEIISLAKRVLDTIGIKKLSLEINSIGCPECRKNYHAALKAYFESKRDNLCETCRDRLERNPMRILDCKSPVCKEICEDAPVVIDYLCDECSEHFESVKKHLDAINIEYTVNPKIVRGLDYYTKTVFEFVSGDIGAQSTVCGGGRYDGLVSQMGGPELASLGFGMGIERLLLVMESQKTELPKEKSLDVYIAPMGDNAGIYASTLCSLIRDEGFSAATDLSGRGLKAQMKYADKCGAKFAVVIGDNELENKTAKLKMMSTSSETQVSLPDGLIKAIYDASISEAVDALSDAAEATLK